MLGRNNILGLSVSQVPNIVNILSEFFIDINPRRIIEIGTAHGGLSVLLKLVAIDKKAQFKTYDIKDHVLCKDIFKQLEIEQELIDCFEAKEEIGNMIQQEGKTVLFCDGGNKSKEMNEFIPYLKEGDIILCHDFAYETMDKSIWQWHESKYEDFKMTAQKHKLLPYKKDLMLKAAWGSFKKI